MSKLLRDLLDAKEPIFTQSLRELELLTGKKGVDVRLTAEVLEKAHSAIRSLGLDSRDTTDKELYHALNHHVAEHARNLTKALGSSEDAPATDIIPKLVTVFEEAKVPKTAWVLKKSVAKDLLREMPPKKMMKHLGYRSLESMFKNENFAEIYVALRFSEGDEWINQYNKLFAKRVAPSNFENRKIELVTMNGKKWAGLTGEFVKKKKHNIAHSKELGVIATIPMQQAHVRGLSLKVLPLLFHYSNEIRLYSAFFKFKSTDPHFGSVVSETLIADSGTGAVVAKFNIHWRVIQRYFGKLDTSPPEVFQPHVQLEDLHWRHTAEELYKISPELKFWESMDYVARLGDDNNPVSLNLFDAAFAYSNQEKFETRYFYHMRESLWNEIFIRYMGERTLRQQVLEQLDGGSIKPETLA